MNNIQQALRDQIYDTVKNIKKHNVGEILNWILRNQVAKYSLANDFYFTTLKTINHFKKLNLDISNRNTFKRKNLITYEHPVPCKIVSLELLKNSNLENINHILQLLTK
jgi:hypothetical protein